MCSISLGWYVLLHISLYAEYLYMYTLHTYARTHNVVNYLIYWIWLWISRGRVSLYEYSLFSYNNNVHAVQMYCSISNRKAQFSNCLTEHCNDITCDIIIHFRERFHRIENDQTKTIWILLTISCMHDGRCANADYLPQLVVILFVRPLHWWWATWVWRWWWRWRWGCCRCCIRCRWISCSGHIYWICISRCHFSFILRWRVWFLSPINRQKG